MTGTKPDYYYRQSAVVPFLEEDGKIKIMLITSRKQGRWIIPKGIVEEDMSPADSAAKEAWEEAGVKGIFLEKPLGSYKYEKWGGICSVEVFAMKIERIFDSWLEDDFRKRKLLKLKKAKELIDDKPLIKIFEKLNELKEK